MSLSCMLMKTEKPKILLVVDDEPLITRAVRKLFLKDFDAIYSVCSSIKAFEAFCCIPITHIVCDFDLGEEKNGIELVAQWRSNFSSIERALIFSGHNLSRSSVPKYIDAVLQKGDSFKHLRESLLAPVEEAQS